MNHVKVLYRECLLGYLTFADEQYIYNSYTVGEDFARRHYPVAMDLYGLYKSKNKTSKEIFPILSDFLEATSRGDIVERAGIVATDSDFEKLVKFSKLNIQSDEFYIAG